MTLARNSNAPVFGIFFVIMLTVFVGFMSFAWPDPQVEQSNSNDTTGVTFSTSAIQAYEYTGAIPDTYGLQLEQISGHNRLRHSVESTLALKCLQERGSFKTFETFGSGLKDENGNPVQTFLHICFNPKTNRYFSVVMSKSGEIWRIVTAYKVDDIMFKTVSNYIGSIIEIWDAVEMVSMMLAPGGIIYNFVID